MYETFVAGIVEILRWRNPSWVDVADVLAAVSSGIRGENQTELLTLR